MDLILTSCAVLVPSHSLSYEILMGICFELILCKPSWHACAESSLGMGGERHQLFLTHVNDIR